MKAIRLTIVVMLFCQAVLAQKISPEQRVEKKVNNLDEKVSLTSTQKEQVEAIYKTTASKMQVLRKDAETNKEAIRELRKEEREKVKAVLTPEQVSQLQELKKAKREQQKASKDKIKDYHKTNVKPVLQAKRQTFDGKLTENEKAVIAQARAKKQEHKKGKDPSNADKNNREDKKAARDEMKLLLKPIVETHKTELKQIYEEVKPALDAEKEFIKANKPENTAKKGTEVKRKKGPKKPNRGDDGERFMYRFLLID